MSLITNGYKRSLTIVVTKKVDGVVKLPYPVTYDGQSYIGLTDDELAELTDAEFNEKLAIVKEWIESQEFGLDFTNLVGTGSIVYDTSVCEDFTITTTTTTTTTTTSTTSTTSSTTTTSTTSDGTTSSSTTTTTTTTTTTVAPQPVIFAVGGNSILRSSDKGTTWETVFTSSTYLYDISFISETVGFACGVADSSKVGAIYKTTDGGDTWIDIYASLPAIAANKTFFSLSKGSPDFVYAGGNLSTFLRYEVLSDVWVNVSNGTSHNPWAIHAFSKNEAIAISPITGSDYILRTTNAGISWTTPVSTPDDRVITDVDFNGDRGVIVCAANATLNKVFTSDDRGATWSTSNPFNFDVNAIESVAFAGSILTFDWWYAVGTDQAATTGKVWVSSDNGNLWANYSNRLPSGTKSLKSCKFISSAEGWVGGNYGEICYTENYGQNWVKQITNINDTILNFDVIWI